MVELSSVECVAEIIEPSGNQHLAVDRARRIYGNRYAEVSVRVRADRVEGLIDGNEQVRRSGRHGDAFAEQGEVLRYVRRQVSDRGWKCAARESSCEVGGYCAGNAVNRS